MTPPPPPPAAGNSTPSLNLNVEATPASLSRVRAVLRQFLQEHDVADDVRAPALLIVHELTANAIEHGSRRQDEIELAITLEPETLLIRVLDPARSDQSPRPLAPDPAHESGRGMLIVDRLAAWHEEMRAGRRQVTVTLPLAASRDR